MLETISFCFLFLIKRRDKRGYTDIARREEGRWGQKIAFFSVSYKKKGEKGIN